MAHFSFQVCMIMILGAAIGILANTFSDSPIPWIRSSEEVQKSEWKQISVEEVSSTQLPLFYRVWRLLQGCF